MQQKLITEFIIEFRSGNFFQSLEAERGGPASSAQIFASKKEVEDFMDKHNWIYFNGGMAIAKK